jgi:hypothetical protein
MVSGVGKNCCKIIHFLKGRSPTFGWRLVGVLWVSIIHQINRSPVIAVPPEIRYAKRNFFGIW